MKDPTCNKTFIYSLCNLAKVLSSTTVHRGWDFNVSTHLIMSLRWQDLCLTQCASYVTVYVAVNIHHVNHNRTGTNNGGKKAVLYTLTWYVFIAIYYVSYT